MKSAKLDKLWDSLHASFWFVPSLMLVLAIGLSFIIIGIDQRRETNIIEQLGWTSSLGPSGSRAILSAIAGSMMTVATTAFSITIVALQLASSQFGPQLLRNFMQDTGNQIVLGTFIGTFGYSLMVLRTINEVEEHEFVPHLAVTVGIGLAIVSIGVLIYFIHHSASSIQVDRVIKKVGDDLDKTIEQLFPEQIGHSGSQQTAAESLAAIPVDFEILSRAITATKSGYIQAIDNNQLMQIATEHDLLLRVEQRPGRFVVNGSQLMCVFPAEKIDLHLAAEIADTVVIGIGRTEQQDLEFSIDQLVEIARRALSSGDPFTASRCIDQLSAALSHFAQREIPSPYCYDNLHRLRVIAEPIAFAEAVDAAFNQIRQYSQSSVPVTIRLLEAIATIAPFTHRELDRIALQRHVDAIERGSQTGIKEELDLQSVKERYLIAVKAIEQF